VRKGAYAAAYSALEGADEAGTPLAAWLRERDVDALDVSGLATDYCVRATALDAAREGFDTRVLLRLTAGVDPVTTGEAVAALRDAGVELGGAAESRPKPAARGLPKQRDCRWRTGTERSSRSFGPTRARWAARSKARRCSCCTPWAQRPGSRG